MSGAPWVVGVSGASGTPYAAAVLRALLDAGRAGRPGRQSRAARLTLLDETGVAWHDDALASLAAWIGARRAATSRFWGPGDLAAGPASGSYPHAGMVVVPASTAAVAGIALGLSKDLLQRAADVTLKERRPLVVVPRETPLGAQHAGAAGGAARRRRGGAAGQPGFYGGATSVQQLVDFVAAKVLDVLGVQHDLILRWTGELGAGRAKS